MGEIISTYAPTSNSDQITLIVCVLIAIIGFYLTYRFLKRKVTREQHNRNVLMAMLFFFAALISTTAAFFSGWSLSKQGQVVLYEEGMKIGRNELAYSSIKRMAVRNDQSSSFVNPQITTRSANILLIESKDGKTYALSSEYYPLGEVYAKLKELSGK